MQYGNDDINLMPIFIQQSIIIFLENGHIFDGKFHVSIFFSYFFILFYIVKCTLFIFINVCL